MASVGNAVAAACQAMQRKLIDLARAAAEGPFAGLPADKIAWRDGGLARTDGTGSPCPMPNCCASTT